jgi:hypothetical protein
MLDLVRCVEGGGNLGHTTAILEDVLAIDEHIVKTLVPVCAFEVFPPKAEAGWAICVGLSKVLVL